MSQVARLISLSFESSWTEGLSSSSLYHLHCQRASIPELGAQMTDMDADAPITARVVTANGNAEMKNGGEPRFVVKKVGG